MERKIKRGVIDGIEESTKIHQQKNKDKPERGLSAGTGDCDCLQSGEGEGI